MWIVFVWGLGRGKRTVKLTDIVNSTCCRGERWDEQKKNDMMNNAKKLYILLWKWF